MDYEVISNKVPKEESLLGTGLRNAVRLGTKAASGIAGKIGDTVAGGLALSDLASQSLGKLTGSETLKQADTSLIRDYLPTSENIHSVGKNVISPLLPRNYLEPQSETEETLDEVASDFGSLLNPKDWLQNGWKNIHKAPNIVRNVGKALGLSGIGNFGKWLAKEAGAGPFGQGVAKIGSMLFSSLIGPYGAEKAMKTLYGEADKLKPKKINLPYSSLKPVVKELEDVVEKYGFDAKYKDALKGPLTGLKKNIKNAGPRDTPHIPLEHALQLKKDINSALRDANIPKEATGLLQKAATSINKLIDRGAKNYPEFLKNYREADDIWQGLYQGNKVSRFLTRNVNLDKFAHPLTYAAFGIGHTLGFGGTAAVAGTVLAGAQGYKIVESLARSKTLQKLYGDAVKASLSGLAQPALRAVKKFDEELRKVAEEDEGFESY